MKNLMSVMTRGASLLLLDGGMGTMLAERGWAPPELPEELNLSRPDVVRGIHRAYIEAGADIIETNTFGGSPVKLAHRGLADRAVEICAAGARLARQAAGPDKLVAGCAGPLGELLDPFGKLSFDGAVDAFRPQFQGLIEGGADFILIETAIDIREVKAAVAALKEVDDAFPFVVSFTFEHKGRTVTGTPPEVAARWARIVGACAVGANCGMGPGAYVDTVAVLHEHSGLPVFIYANAGLPGDGEGEQWGPERYAEAGAALVEAGATVVGGCCRTTPEHIAELKRRIGDMPVLPRRDVSSDPAPFAGRGRLVMERGLVLVGEGVNASRPAVRPHIEAGDWGEIREIARAQTEAGASVLDVNVGLPQVDQAETMKRAVAVVESASDLPLSIDSDMPSVMEAGLKACAGIPLLNSVTAKAGEVERGIALAKKYGAILAVLPMDEDGIPDGAEARCAIARRAAETADRLGYPRALLFIDGLCMAVGADINAPSVGLEVLRLIKSLGCRTMLGLSNISHGMPARGVINRTWLAMAMSAGLDAAIANPLGPGIAETIAAGNLLMGHDENAKAFLASAASFSSSPGVAADEKEKADEQPADAWEALKRAIVRCDPDKAGAIGRSLDEAGVEPREVIDRGVVPALAEVGRLYDSGKFFLPQLLSAAEAAQRVCDAELSRISASGAGSEKSADKGTVLLATVEGDLHDLGKNIVATMLRSYGYRVVDLGKNVRCSEIERAAKESGAGVIGLSALMTGTMECMKEDVFLLKKSLPGVFVIVGGASVSDGYCERIGADGWASDAVGAVTLVSRLLG
ncbi:MAG: homocysteine S-methyltransferase family protein [Synergistaceae bacterium]|jgi:5-methyltetrahydrofolate--homocysteine methyltransferase|nr:homocysteine S-methyltransferase family protein [Synergistaceae bacterium]